MENDVKEVPVVTEAQPTEEVIEVAPGAKTDSALLLESLKEEREKRRLAEAKVAEQEAELLARNQPEADIYSDEGKVLLTRISNIEIQLTSREEREMLVSVQAKFPQIKDKQAEFEQFRSENPGMKLETQAKAFLVENDLFEPTIVRKGLEKSSGGGRVPVKEGMTQEEITKIRLENPRKFREMLKSGQIK